QGVAAQVQRQRLLAVLLPGTAVRLGRLFPALFPGQRVAPAHQRRRRGGRLRRLREVALRSPPFPAARPPLGAGLKPPAAVPASPNLSYHEKSLPGLILSPSSANSFLAFSFSPRK